MANVLFSVRVSDVFFEAFLGRRMGLDWMSLSQSRP